jgi:hypothetical protein
MSYLFWHSMTVCRTFLRTGHHQWRRLLHHDFLKLLSWFWGSHSGGLWRVLSYNAVWSEENQPMFRKNMSSPSLGSKSKPSKKPAWWWKRYVSPKRRLTFTDLHGVIFHKPELFRSFLDCIFYILGIEVATILVICRDVCLPKVWSNLRDAFEIQCLIYGHEKNGYRLSPRLL